MSKESPPKFLGGFLLTPLDLPELPSVTPGPTPSRARSSLEVRFCDPKTP